MKYYNTIISLVITSTPGFFILTSMFKLCNIKKKKKINTKKHLCFNITGKYETIIL